MSDFVSEFLQGQKDASEYKPRDQSRSDDYQRGYTAEFDARQIIERVSK